MKNNLYFENVCSIGNLYLEYVFLEYEEEPVYFTCIDEKNQIYLCLCSEIRGGQRWIISESNTAILEDLIEQRIDMADALCHFDEVVVLESDIEGNETGHLLKTTEIDELDLPKRGTMLRCNAREASLYIFSKRVEAYTVKLQEMINLSYEREGKIKSYSTTIFPMNKELINDLNRDTIYERKSVSFEIKVGSAKYCTNKVATYMTDCDKTAVTEIDLGDLSAA